MKIPTDLDLYEEYREEELPSAADDAATAMMESATPEEEMNWDGVWKEPETLAIIATVIIFLILNFTW